MILKLKFLLSFILILFTGLAQESTTPFLTIGSPAPAFKVGRWIKGNSIAELKKGKIFVLDFWATWCGPCIAEMPHLSTLARKYKDKVSIIGIDIKEKKTTSLQKVNDFVDSMGRKIKFHIVTDDSDFMATEWLEAQADRGIPKSIVINAEGKVAWIGHPMNIDGVLSKLVSNSWDIDKALNKRNEDIRLKKMDWEDNYILNKYAGKAADGYYGDPDSALLVIQELLTKEPLLKYAPLTAYHTISALLITDPNLAYSYGKLAIKAITYNEPSFGAVIDNIDNYGGRFGASQKIYQLGAEAIQAMIDYYPATESTSKNYIKLADWYLRANNKLMAKRALKKAAKALKKS